MRDLKLCNAFCKTSDTITFFRKYMSVPSVERVICRNKKRNQRELSYVEAPDLCLTPWLMYTDRVCPICCLFELRLHTTFVSFWLSFIKQYSSCNLFINLAVCITIAAERLCAWNEEDLLEIRGMGQVLVLNCLLYSFRIKKIIYLDFGTCEIQDGKNFLFNIESCIYI